jgi:hypothetical protein
MTLTPTPTAEARAKAAIAAEDATLSREAYMSESEKNPRGDPITVAVEPTERAEVLDIAPREPYPTGNPHQPSWAEINGFTGPLVGDTVIGQQQTSPRGEVDTSSLA